MAKFPMILGGDVPEVAEYAVTLEDTLAFKSASFQKRNLAVAESPVKSEM